jgi:hypothetical protein
MEQSGKLAPLRVSTTHGLYASFPGGVAPLKELTLRGATLEERDPLPIGSRLQLTLHLGTDNVRCIGLVERSILDEGMEVEFVDVSPDDRKHLVEYITAAVAAESRARLNTSLRGAPAIAPSPPAAAPAAKPAAPLPRIAELLVRRGAVTSDRLAVAVEEYRRRGGRFCAVLLELGVVSDKALAVCFNEEYRIPLVDVTTIDPTSEALRMVPYELAHRHELLPIGVTSTTLTIATSDPSNLEARDELKLHSGRDLAVAVAPAGLLREAIHYFYHERARDAG